MNSQNKKIEKQENLQREFLKLKNYMKNLSLKQRIDSRVYEIDKQNRITQSELTKIRRARGRQK